MNNAEELYRFFGEEVRKESTAVVLPPQWNRIMFVRSYDWIKSKLPNAEFNQKRIDDLEAIRVVTDGIQRASLAPDDKGNFNLPDDYFYGLNVMFNWNMAEEGERINLIPSEWELARILRTDNRGILNRNPYRIPNNTSRRYYFEILDGKIRPIYTTAITPYRMRLEYYRKPVTIKFVPEGTSSIGDFSFIQNSEILALAVQKYLERVSNPRLQTFTGVESQIPK